MSANASTKAKHVESLDSESLARNRFASLASLFEKSASDVKLSSGEIKKLAQQFGKQLRDLSNTLDASSLGQIHLSFALTRFSLVLSHDPDLACASCLRVLQNMIWSSVLSIGFVRIPLMSLLFRIYA